MRIALLLILWICASAAPAKDEAGVFDYYVLALSWTPTWCALEGDDRGSEQCDADTGYGWTLHGLWPQYHVGWPDYCPSDRRPPSRAQTGAMADIMGSGGLAWHQWRKHGVCTGLAAQDYFDLSRDAYRQINRPAVFRALDAPVSLPASVVEAAFLKANPSLEPDMVTVTCKRGRIQEVRICMSKSLEPVPCGRDVVRDCALDDALFDPLR